MKCLIPGFYFTCLAENILHNFLSWQKRFNFFFLLFICLDLFVCYYLGFHCVILQFIIVVCNCKEYVIPHSNLPFVVDLFALYHQLGQLLQLFCVSSVWMWNLSIHVVTKGIQVYVIFTAKLKRKFLWNLFKITFLESREITESREETRFGFLKLTKVRVLRI